MGIRRVARVTEEQLREDQQELKTREKKMQPEDAKKIRGIVHENNKNKRTSRVQNELGKLMHHDEQELLSLWEGWHSDGNEGGWLDPELCTKARREEVENIRRHKMYTAARRLPGRHEHLCGWCSTACTAHATPHKLGGGTPCAVERKNEGQRKK